jgi:hypothetical protein
MVSNTTSNTHYSEAEAARALGVSVDELRSLIRRHIAETEDQMNNIPAAQFAPTDLVLLRLLSANETPSKLPG